MTEIVDPEVLSCVPHRRAAWRVDDDGLVVAERPRPTTRGLRGGWDRLRWLMSHPRIRLDELGSHVWCGMDGAATLEQIARATGAVYPDRTDNMAERVALFAMALHHQGLIELRAPAPP